uniref:Myb-like DNA-binding domain-containing protein n=1 Tax=Trepomonas sp. PC1 TaxID=1076344 RepID=A0A146K4Z8_9EUKA|eukprot:JAP90706.1 Myb-like DNA-binding domain-containing protein [Trepomonas sp. PC1]
MHLQIQSANYTHPKQMESQNYLHKRGQWTEDEHKLFIQCVLEFGIGKWKMVSQVIGNRSSSQCQIHYYKLKSRMDYTDDQMMQYYANQKTPERSSESISHDVQQPQFEPYTTQEVSDRLNFMMCSLELNEW